MVFSTSSRTGGPNRRSSSSRSSAFIRFSVTSSSISRSSFLVTRKTWCCTICMPLNSSPRCAAITSSIGTNRSLDALTNRGNCEGTFTRANTVCPVAGLRTMTARFSESPEMYGNGCAGSTASGVSTGRSRSRKSLRSAVRSSLDRSSQRTIAMPASASSGQIWSWKTAVCRSARSSATVAIRVSASLGFSPPAVRSSRPVAIRRLSPATRTRKNSSRLLAKMARKRTRSSSGTEESSASSRTRSLNWSQLSSRLRNRSLGMGACAGRSASSGSRSGELWADI